MKTKNQIMAQEYPHYNDYTFKGILQKRANGLLEFVGIPYRINKLMISEITNLGPSISRMDFVGEAQNEEKRYWRRYC